MKVSPDQKLLAVAPMMAWTDRHCRFLHRLYAPQALLFTEMVTTGALLHGRQWHQLDYNPEEHPLALQLGGNDPAALAECAAAAAARGYDEINLNVGCPSDRVQQGAFGAKLMLQPRLVRDCVAAMVDACDIPVTVKCRLGVDDADNDELLLAFVETVAEAGCQRFYVHARKAILAGLSPAQNRSIPPLQPERAYKLKQRRPDLQIIVNGGITNSSQALDYLQWADGVMIGRAAYHHPELMRELNQLLFVNTAVPDRREILEHYRSYVARQLAAGEPLHSMTRHLLNACHGVRGARRFRQILSNAQRRRSEGLTILDEALQHILPDAA